MSLFENISHTDAIKKILWGEYEPTAQEMGGCGFITPQQRLEQIQKGFPNMSPKRAFAQLQFERGMISLDELLSTK